MSGLTEIEGVVSIDGHVVEGIREWTFEQSAEPHRVSPISGLHAGRALPATGTISGVWSRGSKNGAHAIAIAMLPQGQRFTLNGILCEVTHIDEDGTGHFVTVSDG